MRTKIFNVDNLHLIPNLPQKSLKSILDDSKWRIFTNDRGQSRAVCKLSWRHTIKTEICPSPEQAHCGQLTIQEYAKDGVVPEEPSRLYIDHLL